MPKNREPLPDFSEVHVRLKPILGIVPGLYLTVLYALALVTLVFLFLVLPGLRANGTLVTFVTEPRGTGVWVDGAYRGATPCEVLVARGDRQVELRKAFYQSVVIQKKFAGRVFGSLLVPRRDRIVARVRISDAPGLAAWAGAQVAQWGLLRDFSPAYPLPPVLTEAVGSLARLRDPAALRQARALLATAAAAADSQAELREVVAAAAAYASRGGVLTPVAVGRVLSMAAGTNRAAVSLPLWITQALDSSSPVRASLLASPALAAHVRRVLDAVRRAEAAPATGMEAGAPVVGGIRFLPVAGGVQLVGRTLAEAAARVDASLPVPVRVPPFYLGETEVTREQYAQFLAVEPRWADRMALMRDGRATAAYLDGWDGARFPAGSGGLAVTGVSWYAAQAYCAWLTTRLPAALGGYEVRLASEAEWQRAAGAASVPGDAVFQGAGGLKPAGTSQPGPYGQRDLWGNAWEWCGDYYLPVRNLVSSLDPGAADPLSAAVGAERVVKGGSWANAREDFRTFVRGSQPPDWCTPYTGFRAALARRPGSGK